MIDLKFLFKLWFPTMVSNCLANFVSWTDAYSLQYENVLVLDMSNTTGRKNSLARHLIKLSLCNLKVLGPRQGREFAPNCKANTFKE